MRLLQNPVAGFDRLQTDISIQAWRAAHGHPEADLESYLDAGLMTLTYLDYGSSASFHVFPSTVLLGKLRLALRYTDPIDSQRGGPYGWTFLLGLSDPGGLLYWAGRAARN